MATLAELVQSLPQELFDRVAEHTFATPDPDGQKPKSIEKATVHVTIDKSYKPPFHLQINRTTRAAFAKKYYSKSIHCAQIKFASLLALRLSISLTIGTDNVLFIAPHPAYNNILYKWANSLTDTHCDAIRFVQLNPTTEDKMVNARRGLSAVVVKVTRTDPGYPESDVYGLTKALRRGSGGDWFPSMVGIWIYVGFEVTARSFIEGEHGSG